MFLPRYSILMGVSAIRILIGVSAFRMESGSKRMRFSAREWDSLIEEVFDVGTQGAVTHSPEILQGGI